MKPNFRILSFLAYASLASLATLHATEDTPADKTSAPLISGIDDLKKLDAQLATVVDRMTAATVALTAPNGGASGSGVIVSSDGLILTASHVMSSAGEEVVVTFQNGKRVKAKALGADYDRDAAMLKISDPGEYPFVKTADAAHLPINSWCVALGHPGGFDILRTTPIRLGRVIFYGNFLMTDCTVVSGDSGGPLFDIEGRVIGIHANIGLTLGENRHVPIEVFHSQWNDLISGKRTGKLFNTNSNQAASKEAEGKKEAVAGEPAPADEDLDAFLDRSFGESKDGKVGLRLTPELIEKFGGIKRIQERIQEKRAKKMPDSGNPQVEEPPKQKPKSELDISKLMERVRSQTKANGGQIELTPEEFDALGGLDGVSKIKEKLSAMPAAEDEFHKSVINALKPLASAASPSICAILADGKEVALGTVISENGGILTKNSETENGTIRARFKDVSYPATLLKRFPEWDLALFHIPANGFTPISFNAKDSPTPSRGDLLTVPGPGEEPLGIGVVSVKERPMSGMGYIGIVTDPAITSPGEILVQAVAEAGPAALAGVKAGDAITMINGKPVTNAAEFTSYVTALKPGDTAKLEIERDGEKLSLEVVLGERPLQQPSEDFLSVNRLSGPLSPKIDGFPFVLQHDIPLTPSQCGSPLLDLEGLCLGINVSRAGRVNTLAVPSSSIAILLESTQSELTAAAAKADAEPEITADDIAAVRMELEKIQDRLRKLEKKAKIKSH